MSGATTGRGLPYPTSGDPVVVHTDVRALAEKADIEIGVAVDAVKPKQINSAMDLGHVDLLDTVRYSAGAVDWAAQHYPAAVAGVVSTYRLVTGNDAQAVQTFVSRDTTPRMWTRGKTAGSWSAWTEIGGAALPAAYGDVDLDTLTRGTRRFSAGAFTNGPAGMAAGMVETTALTNGDTYLLQVATEWTYSGEAGRLWTRRKNVAGWSAWGLIGPTPPSTGGGSAGGTSGYKVVAVPLNGGQTATSNSATTMTVRQVIDLTAPITRARLRFRNVDIRGGSTKATTATVSDIYAGPHTGSGAASSLTKVASGFTVAAAEVASTWIDLDHDGSSELLITYTVTAAAGEMFTNYGDVWTKTGAAHTETAPTGLYRTYTTPLAVTMDVQTAPSTPVLAVAGDSNSIGVGAAGLRDAWGWRLARRLKALPQLLGSSGDTIAGSRTFTAYKWTRVTGNGRATADALLWALGQNDLGAGTTSTAILAMLAEDIPKARALIAPGGVHAVTFMPRDNEDPSSAFEVQRRVLNTALKDQRPSGLLDVHDIVPVVSTDDETIRPEYKGGGGGTDPVHLNALGFQAVADSITKPVLPAPASGVTVVDHGTYLTLTIGD